MRWKGLVLVLAIFGSLGGLMTCEAAPLVPLRDFFRNPELSSVEWSPDGTQLAFLAPVERRFNLFVQKPDEDKPKQITNVTDRDIGGYFWKNGHTLVYLKDDGGDENFHLYAVNIDNGKTIDLTPFLKE